eukprot:7460697-Ditylum_brightwellii.AAC.1
MRKIIGRSKERIERWKIGKKGIIAHDVQSMDQDGERVYQVESMQEMTYHLEGQHDDSEDGYAARKSLNE